MINLNSLTNQHIISELWRRGELSYLLHPGQLEYLQFTKQSKYIKNMLHCGRGWGKTWFFLCLAMEYAIKHPNSRIVYATQTRESARQIIIPTYKMLTLGVPENVKPQWKTQGHSIDFSNGSSIVVEGADDDHGNKLRGAFAHLAICDELGFWSHADYVVNHILLPQCQRVAGRMYLTSTTPESLGHEFYKFVIESKSKDTYYRKTIYDNPRLTSEQVDEYAKQCGGYDSTMFKREYLCEDVVETSRSVIPEFSRNNHIVNDILSLKDKNSDSILSLNTIFRPEYYDNYTAMDLGLVDNTHVLFSYYDFENATVVIEDELCINYKTTDEIAKLIKEKESNYNKPPKIRVCDNDLQQITDLSITHKLTFVPAQKYDKEAAINKVRNMFAQNRIKIHERCHNLIHQLIVGIWNNRRTDYERLAGAGHLDGIDALVYLCRTIDYQHNPYVAQHDQYKQFINPRNSAKQGYEDVFGRRL